MLSATLDQKEFIAAYQEAFAGPPYFEDYSYEEVLGDVLLPHLRDGLVMVAQDMERGGKLIGFGCALPYEKSPDDVKEFLEGLHQSGHLPEGFKHHRAWYMSELGVLDEYRGLGAAYELVLQRMWSMDFKGADQYFMRTAAVGSNSYHMYVKIGSERIPVLQDVSATVQATENHTHSLQRVYLWGNCREATSNIERIKRENGYIPFLPPEGMEEDGSTLTS